MRVVPTQRPDLTISVLDGEAVVLDLSTSTASALNSLALRVFQAAGRPVVDVAVELRVSESVIEAACDDLVERGLLVAGGWSRRSALRGGAIVAGAALVSTVTMPAAANAASTPAGGGGGNPGTPQVIDISSTGTVLSHLTDDDNARTATSGFPIQLYGTSTTTPLVSTNGVIGLGNSSAAPADSLQLPYAPLGTAAVVYWDDLYVYPGQSITYDTVGTAGSRIFVVQWTVGYYSGGDAYFQAQFFEDTPGKVAYLYINAADGRETHPHGGLATIGTQSATGAFDQYSFHTAKINNGTVLVFNHP